MDLRRHNFVLRLREELDDNDQIDKCKLTLKYRSADRYHVAHQNLTVAHKNSDDPKFEEDIVPPFNSKFSYSVSFKSKKPFEDKEIDQLKNIASWFPGLRELRLPGATPV